MCPCGRRKSRRRGSEPSSRVEAPEQNPIADAVEGEGLCNPAVIVIGEVAGLHGLLDWSELAEPAVPHSQATAQAERLPVPVP